MYNRVPTPKQIQTLVKVCKAVVEVAITDLVRQVSLELVRPLFNGPRH